MSICEISAGDKRESRMCSILYFEGVCGVWRKSQVPDSRGSCGRVFMSGAGLVPLVSREDCSDTGDATLLTAFNKWEGDYYSK